MAINLWTLGGKPSWYNPLPTGWGNYIDIGIGDFLVKVKAKSSTGARLQITDMGNEDILKKVDLTSDSKVYEFVFTSKVSQRFYLYDEYTRGDIIIQDIQLVEKPLERLTLNGIDGFTSGKWTLHANARVVDDETVVHNPLALGEASYLTLNVEPNTNYAYQIDHNGSIGVYVNGSTPLVSYTTNKIISFNSGNNTSLRFYFRADASTGTFTFKHPMLNLGTTPAPYSRKTGDRMVEPVVQGKNLFSAESYNAGKTVVSASLYKFVLTGLKPNVNYTASTNYPNTNDIWFGGSSSNEVIDVGTSKTILSSSTGTIEMFFRNPNSHNVVVDKTYWLQVEQGTQPTPYEPYKVGVNNRAVNKVPRKNLINKDSFVTPNYVDSISGNIYVSGVDKHSSDWILVKPNTTYSLTGISGGYFEYAYYNGAKGFSSGALYTSQGTIPSTLTTNGTTSFIRLSIMGSDKNTAQLEQGTPTPYEPFQLVNPPVSGGLVLDGVSNYVQLPSMTMDAIEIDCLIDNVQKSGYANVIDARSGKSGAYLTMNSGVMELGTGFQSVTGFKKGERTLIRVSSNVAFTDDVTFFAGSSTLDRAKGVIYKVTCYLNGAVVAHYDFTNPQNIVGTTIIPNAVNLLPTFDSGEWSLHSNARVLGKDVLRLDATTSGFESSYFDIPVEFGKTYSFGTIRSIGRIGLTPKNSSLSNSSQSAVSTTGTSVNITITTADTKFLRVVMDNNAVAGSYIFEKPQLIQLNGTEGTINGSPVRLKKPSKRTLFAKR